MIMKKHNCRCLTILTFCFTFLLLFSSNVFSAFSISPIRIFFDGSSKTNIVNVKNVSEEEIMLEMKTVLWENRDDFSPTKDIIFFPKILVLKKGEEKIVRIGHRIPETQTEKTYRMFIKQLPKITERQGSTVNIIMQMGVPIFIQPSTFSPEGTIEKVAFSEGNLNVFIENHGNVHFFVKSINVSGTDDSGADVFSANQAGWYVLAGNSGEFTMAMDREVCLNTKNLQVVIETDRLSMNRTFDISNETCTP